MPVVTGNSSSCVGSVVVQDVRLVSAAADGPVRRVVFVFLVVPRGLCVVYKNVRRM